MILNLRATFLALLLIWFPVGAAQAQRAKLDSALEARITALMARMTLAEKIGQLNRIARDERTNLQMEAVKSGNSSAIMNVVKPDEIRGFRDAARTTRLGIPLIIGLDAVHSFRITHPVPFAWAATWNPEQASHSAEMVAREAANAGINWTSAPMVDLSRDPRWGRVIEGAGEDAHLGSAIAAARTRGYRRGGLAVSVKHYVGYAASKPAVTTVTRRSQRASYSIATCRHSRPPSTPVRKSSWRHSTPSMAHRHRPTGDC